MGKPEGGYPIPRASIPPICAGCIHRRAAHRTRRCSCAGSYEKEGGILAQRELYARRAPGTTCLSALRSGRMGTMEEPINDSKGCGGVMRVAPVGLFLF